MKFRQWLENTVPVDDLPQQIFKSIQFIVEGNWVVQDTRRLMPSFRDQAYGLVEMRGRNIRKPGDRFYVKVFYEVRKTLQSIPHPPYISEPEETKDAWQKQYGEPEQKVTQYRPAVGHHLLKLRGFVEGRKPHDEWDEVGSFEELATPGEVAEKVRALIDKFYFGGDEGPEEKAPEPSPSTELVGVEWSLDREKRSRLRKRSLQPVVRQAAIYT